MPACSFQLTHAGTPETLFLTAKSAIADAGGTITGSPQSGTVSIPSPLGTVRFTYTTSGRTLNVQVTSKPLLLPCAEIQSSLADMLAQVPAPEPITVQGETVKVSVHETDINFTPDETKTVVVPARRHNMLLLAGVALAIGGLAVAQQQLGGRRRGRRRSPHRRTLARALHF